MIAANIPEQSRSRQLKALGLTLGIHAALLLIFFTVRYAAPAPVPPPVEELGMEVNLGSSADGFGTSQPEIVGGPASPTPTLPGGEGAISEEATEPVTAPPSDDPDAAEITPKQEAVKPKPPKPTPPKTAPAVPVKKPTTATAVTKPAEALRRPKVLFPGSTGTGGNGASRDAAGSEGNTFGSGDRGVPGGTPGAKNYEGSPGKGTGGVNHTLSGRTIIAPRLEGNFRNGGTVKMRVTVNRAGAIVNSSVLSGSGELTALAKEKLRQVRFSAAPEGPVEQFGTVTFVFKTTQ